MRDGTAILAYQAQVIATHVKKAWMAPDYLRFPAGVPMVNATTLISEIGHALLIAYPKAPFVVMYQDIPGKRVFSLRSEDSRMDVSEVAKARGGGGHRNAAGYSE